MVDDDFFATILGDLLFLYDNGLDRVVGSEKGTLQFIYRRWDMTFTSPGNEMTFKIMKKRIQALVLGFAILQLLPQFIVCFLCNHVFK
jgi:hypothetical protein